MKYVVIIGDGMADFPLEEIGGKTPLMCSKKPYMDMMARRGLCGKVVTVPDGYPPQSDVACMSLFGYDPRIYYTGRAPIELYGMGLEMEDSDVAYRCNLVYIENGKMVDYSGGHVSNEEARELIEALNQGIGKDEVKFYFGLGYRNIMVWKDGNDSPKTFPPHDIQGKEISQFLPEGEGSDFLKDLMKKANEVLIEHRVNELRGKKGLNPVNSIWLWGQGRKANLEPFQSKFGLKGATVCAVNLIKGISRLGGLFTPEVEGATGYLDTDYLAKGKKAIELLDEFDLVYVHVEAPDEASHEGKIEEKIRAIESIDEKIVGPIYEKWGKSARFLITTDHFTPIRLRTHYGSPTPFVIYQYGMDFDNQISGYDESIKGETVSAQSLLSLFFGKMNP